AVTYTDISDAPSSANRSISFAVNDGSGDSLAATKTVSVAAVNDAPVLGGTGNTIGYTEQLTAVAIDAGITLSDGDNQNLASATVTVSTGLLAGDMLHFTDQNGISGSYDAGTGALTLSGSATVAQYQAALRSVTFENQTDNPTD